MPEAVSSQNTRQVSFLSWVLFWLFNFTVIRHAYLPPDNFPDFIPDKIAHMGEYFLMGMIALNAFQYARTAWIRERRVLWALIWSLSLGALGETLQLFVPERVSSFMDFAADGAGVMLALLGYGLWRHYRAGKVLTANSVRA